MNKFHRFFGESAFLFRLAGDIGLSHANKWDFTYQPLLESKSRVAIYLSISTKKPTLKRRSAFSILAPVRGLEPLTTRLTVECATIAPHRNGILKGSLVIRYFSVGQLAGPYFIWTTHGQNQF
jgi:hypothetical protein